MDVLKLRRLTPVPVKRVLSGGINALDPLAVRRWRQVTGDTASPIPPRKLRARVGDPRIEHWVPSGAAVARELEELLDAHARPLTTFRSICDFGCGSGRILAQLEVHPDALLHGTDVDSEAIGWLSARYPRIRAKVNSSQPPAPFPAESFDLICSISIFTHLNEQSQRLWLAELSRLLGPGGLAVLTTLGEGLRIAWARGERPGITEHQLSGLQQATSLASSGFLFVPEERSRWNEWRYKGVESDYGLAFWDPDAIRAVWSEWFEVVAVLQGALNWRQDAVLLAPKRV